MGGRKKSSRKPVVRKPPPPLDKEFACPFCNNERVVICKLYARPEHAHMKRLMTKAVCWHARTRAL